MELLNEHIPAYDGTDRSPVTFSVNVDLKKYYFRTMYQKISETAEYLDERIESFIPEILSHHNISPEQLGNPALPLQTEIVAIGRIVPETPADEKLNKQSVYFESCRRIGAGMRIKLTFQENMPFHFFPGQIVALRGSNASGEYFAVTEILDLPLLYPAASPLTQLKEYNSKKAPLKVITAAGPFTLNNELDFSPLDDLIKETNDFKPDALILMGPFIDVTNQVVMQGTFEVHNANGEVNPNASLDDLFRETISSRIKQIDSSITVVMIPHVRDTASNHPAFPQSPFNRKDLDLPKEVKCLSNPATFSLNEVVFTVSTQDVMSDLIRVTTQHSMQKTFFETCMEDILSQRTVYPQFPGSVTHSKSGDFVTSASLDIPYMGLAEFTHALPDVLIVSSTLKPTAQIISNVVTLNPGVLAKARGGQFAKFTISNLDCNELPSPSPSNGGDENDDTGVVHDVWKRARLEIVKI